MAQKNVATIRISLGLFSTNQGGLYSVKDNSGTRDTNLKLVCPSCQNSLLDQVYCCQAGCKPDESAPAARPEGWKTGEIGDDRVRVEGRGKDAKLTLVSAAEIEAAKTTTFPKGELSLAVCPAAQVEAHTYPGGATYCFVPESPDKVYALLLKAAANPDRALVGILNMRGNENLYRLSAYEGTLRVVELLRPEETATYEPLTLPVVKDEEQDLFDKLVEAVQDDFEPEQYASNQLANLKDLLASKASGVIVPITSAAGAKKPQGDMTDALLASLAAAKADKAAKVS